MYWKITIYFFTVNILKVIANFYRVFLSNYLSLLYFVLKRHAHLGTNYSLRIKIIGLNIGMSIGSSIGWSN